MVGATGFEPATSSSQKERNFLIHSIFQQFLIGSILFGAVWLNFDRIHSENLRVKVFFLNRDLVHQSNT